MSIRSFLESIFLSKTQFKPDLLSKRISILEAENARLKKSLVESERTQESRAYELKVSEKESARLRANLENANKNIPDWFRKPVQETKRTSILEAENARLKKSLAESERAQESRTYELKVSEKESARLRANLENANKNIPESLSETVQDDLHKKISNLEAENSRLGKALAQSEKNLASRLQELEVSANDVARLSSSLAKSKAKQLELTRWQEELEEQLLIAKRSLQALKRSYALEQTTIHTQHVEVATNFKSRISSLTAKLAHRERRIEQMALEVTELDRKLQIKVEKLNGQEAPKRLTRDGGSPNIGGKTVALPSENGLLDQENAVRNDALEIHDLDGIQSANTFEEKRLEESFNGGDGIDGSTVRNKKGVFAEPVNLYGDSIESEIDARAGILGDQTDAGILDTSYDDIYAELDSTKINIERFVSESDQQLDDESVLDLDDDEFETLSSDDKVEGVLDESIIALELEFADDIGPTAADQTKPAERLSRTQRARQIATAMADEYDLAPKYLDLLAKIFEIRWWSTAKTAVQGLIERKSTVEELSLVHQIRLYWSENLEFSVYLNASETSWSRIVELPWNLTLDFVRCYQGLPDSSELENYLHECHDVWGRVSRLQENFPSFLLFFKKIVDSSADLDQLPPAEYWVRMGK